MKLTCNPLHWTGDLGDKVAKAFSPVLVVSQSCLVSWSWTVCSRAAVQHQEKLATYVQCSDFCFQQLPSRGGNSEDLPSSQPLVWLWKPALLVLKGISFCKPWFALMQFIAVSNGYKRCIFWESSCVKESSIFSVNPRCAWDCLRALVTWETEDWQKFITE